LISSSHRASSSLARAQRLGANGDALTDSLGNLLYDCSRGSNHPEAHHKGLVTTFGTWFTGVEMASYLLKWHRHRYNQRVSEQRRPDYPVLGMYDTWLIDKLQVLLREN
jgi:hypothetical protein